MITRVSLSELVTIRGGGTPDRQNPDYWDGDIPWASVKDLKDIRLENTQEFITEKGVKNSATNIIPTGTIVVATRMAVGKACITGLPVAINQDLKALFCSPELSPQYLLWFLLSVSKKLEVQASGATVKGIKIDALNQLKIPLPPLEGQRRIAAILDKADAVRRKRQQAIALTEELLRSAFLEMFGNPIINPRGWEEVELGGLLTFLTSGSRGWAKFYAPEGRLFLRIQNVRDGKLLLDDIAYVSPPDSAEARRTRVKEGDVLVSITADLGRTAVIPKGFKPAHINQHLALLRLKRERISPVYLAAFLASISGQLQFARLNREGVKAGLNFDDIRGLHILLPPLETQLKYEKFFIRQTDALNQYKQGCNAAQSLFNSLLQRAFCGEL
jgi:type I restriction enzyme S subunit